MSRQALVVVLDQIELIDGRRVVLDSVIEVHNPRLSAPRMVPAWRYSTFTRPWAGQFPEGVVDGGCGETGIQTVEGVAQTHRQDDFAIVVPLAGQ